MTLRTCDLDIADVLNFKEFLSSQEKADGSCLFYCTNNAALITGIVAGGFLYQRAADGGPEAKADL
jgi:hypothetical protein